MGICGILLASGNAVDEVTSKTLYTIPVGGWEIPFTNHMFVIGLAGVVMMITFPLVIRHSQLIPRGFII